MWPLVSGYNKPDGTRDHPAVAMVANLAKQMPDHPALMSHRMYFLSYDTICNLFCHTFDAYAENVVLFFHEMGHVFHDLLSKTKYGRFHGVNVTRDFEEAPSQMLENWCFEPEVLKKMSSHYKTQESLPSELITKIIETCVTVLSYLKRITCMNT
jgi:Zn-dependent oligopeptidase